MAEGTGEPEQDRRSEEISFSVDVDRAGQRIDQVLADLCGLPRSQVSRRRIEKHIARSADGIFQSHVAEADAVVAENVAAVLVRHVKVPAAVDRRLRVKVR